MQNTVETIEGNASVVKSLQIIWQTPEGPYRYIPVKEDKVKLRIFDVDGIKEEKDCTIEDDEVVVTFPDNYATGDYDYEIVIIFPDSKPKTILSSKFHVARR